MLLSRPVLLIFLSVIIFDLPIAMAYLKHPNGFRLPVFWILTIGQVLVMSWVLSLVKINTEASVMDEGLELGSGKKKVLLKWHDIDSLQISMGGLPALLIEGKNKKRFRVLLNPPPKGQGPLELSEVKIIVAKAPNAKRNF
jgi:hypothetical protein